MKSTFLYCLIALCTLSFWVEAVTKHDFSASSLVSDEDFGIVMDCIKEHKIPLPEGSDEITDEEWRNWTPQQQLVVIQCIAEIIPDPEKVKVALQPQTL